MGAELSETGFPKLSHPPLKEVLVDIRLREELPLSVLSVFKAPKGFPIETEMKHGRFQIKMGRDAQAHGEVLGEERIGWRYDREDRSEVVQFRRNGFTYSILANYQGWDALEEKARTAWLDYMSTSGPIKVGRMAVRYINAIDIPLGSDYDEYLTTGPRVPESVPPIVASFLQRVVIPFEKDASTVIFTQALEIPNPSVVLDIDAFTECSLDGAAADIWSKLKDLRGLADKIFFASITEKVLNLYK